MIEEEPRSDRGFRVQGLRCTAASGLIWSTLGQAIKLGSQVAGVIILVPLLPASDFGIVAMASVLTGFALLFRDLGTAAAVIQRRVLTQALLDSVFWLNIAVGVGLSLALILLSPVLVWFFAEPRLHEVVWLLSLSFPLGAIGLVQQALLERAADFRPVALIESGSALLGAGSAVWAASSGWGVYSLVTQTLVSALITAIGPWLVSSWRPGAQVRLSEIKSLWNFSGNLVGFNVLNYFSRNADNVLVGRFLGSTELGYYTVAYRLMLWPLQNISRVVGRVLFPVFSRLQEDQNRLASAYVQATVSIVVITAPLMFGFFVLREPLVEVLFGERWKAIVDILAWLVPVGMLQTIVSTVGSLYLAMGRTDLMFKWGIFAGLLVVPAFATGLIWGVRGVAMAYAIASLILFWPSLAIPFRLVGLNVGNVIVRLLPGVTNAALMAIVVATVAAAWPAEIYDPMMRLILLVGIGILTYGSLSLLTQRTLLKGMAQAVFNRSL